MPRFKRLALLHHSAIILLSICFVTTSRYLYSFIFITLFNKLCDDDDDDDDTAPPAAPGRPLSRPRWRAQDRPAGTSGPGFHVN